MRWACGRNVPVKINFLNKLLDANLAQNVSPPPALVTGARAPFHS